MEIIQYIEDKYCWGSVFTAFYVEEGQVASTCEIQLVKGQKHSFICGLHTVKKYRNKGYATYILEELEKLSRRNGRYIVELETEADDEYAQKFYEKRGYVKVPELTYSSDYGTYFTFRKVMEKVEGEI